MYFSLYSYPYLTFFPGMSIKGLLNAHHFWINDKNAVSIAAPDVVLNLNHASDGVVGLAQIQQVIVGQVPLGVGQPPMENGDAAIGQRCQNSSLDMTEMHK